MTVTLDPLTRYQIERASAGNPLFCPMVLSPLRLRRGIHPLFEDGAQLFKLLMQAGVRYPQAYPSEAITEIAEVFAAAIEYGANENDCSEYMIYMFEGLPKPNADEKRLRKLKAIIGTFYGNLLVTHSLGRR